MLWFPTSAFRNSDFTICLLLFTELWNNEQYHYCTRDLDNISSPLTTAAHVKILKKGSMVKAVSAECPLITQYSNHPECAELPAHVDSPGVLSSGWW